MTVVLVELSPYDPATTAVVTLRACSHDDARVTSLDGETWWPALARKPRLTMDLFDGDFSGRITPAAGDLELDLSAFPDAARYSWADKPARIWTGTLGDAFADYTLLFDGLTSGATVEDGRLRLTLRVNDTWLDAQLLTAEYGGAGGADGHEEIKGNPKELVLGAPRNIEPKLMDAINSVYQYHGYGSAHGLIAAFENGVEFPASVGNYASYAALVAATIAPGYVGTCNAEGMVRHGAPPVGLITYDVEGDDGGVDGWVRTPGAVIKRIALLAGATSDQIDEASLDALDAAVPRTLSIQVKQQTTARALIQAVAASCNAAAGVSWLGKLFVARVGIGTPALTLKADGSALPPVGRVAQLEVGAPFWKMQMGAERCWRVHQGSEIADDGGGEQTFYRRAFALPAAPADPEAEGWTAERPTYSEPSEYGVDFTLGPISRTGAIYAVKRAADGTIGAPYLDDQDYVGVALLPPNKFTPYNSTTPNPAADLIEVATHQVTRDATPTNFETVSGVGSVPFPDTFAWSFFALSNGFDIEFEITSLGSDANGIEAYAGIGTGTPSLTGSGLDVTPIDFGFWFKQAGASRWEPSTSTAARVHIVADSAIQTASVVGLDKGGVNEPALLTRYRMTYDGFIVGFYINGEPVCHSASFFQDFAYRNLVIALASPESSIRVTRFQEIPLANRPGIDSVAYMSGPIVFDNDSFAIYMPYDDNDAGNASAFQEVHFEATTGAVVWDFIVDHDEVDLWAGLYGDTSSGYGELSIRFYGDGTYQIYRNATGQGIVAMPSTSFLAVRLSYDGTFMRCYLDGTQVHSYGVTVPQHRTYRVLNLRRSFAILISSRFAVSPISSTVGVAPTALPTDTDIGTKTWTEADTVTRNGYNAYPLADFEVTVGTAEGGVQQVLSVIANITYTLNSTNKPSIATGTLIGYYLTSSTSSATTWLPIDMSPEALALPSNPDTTNPTSTGLISFPPGAYTFEIYGVVTDSMSGGGNYSITATGTHITRAFN